jgi:hypothetical protein
VGQAFADAAGWHPGPIILRTSWPRVLAPAVGSGLTPLVVPFVLGVTNHQPPSGFDPFWAWFPLPIAVAITLLSLWGERRKQLVLRAGSLSVRIGWRKRKISAADIVAVTLEREVGTRLVTLWTRDGKRHRIGVAGRTQGLWAQHFERDWHLIGQWWLANRGYDWQPQIEHVPTFATSSGLLTGFDWRPQY